jgi:hypothetical protein
VRVPFAACAVISLIFAPAAWAEAPSATPIPPEVWNLKEADSQGTGAIILERRLALDSENFEYYYLIRIVNEAGKGAIPFLRLSDFAEDVWGRTLTRSGETFKLDPKKDVLVKTTFEGWGGRVGEKVVVPPGLTSDCVVEIHWRDPQVFSRPGWWYEVERGTTIIPLALPYPIRKEVVSLPERFSYAWRIKGGPVEPERTGTSLKVFTYKDVPAAQDLPFSLYWTRNLPKLTLYHVPVEMKSYVDQDPDTFWATAGKAYYRDIFSHVSAGGRYRDWAVEVLKNLPATPQAAAYELALRLDSRIKNLSTPTYQEKAAIGREASRQRVHPKDLDETVATGRTNADGMVHLYLRLLADAHLAAQVLFVADRNKNFLDRAFRDVAQYHDILVGVPEAGKPVFWVDPGMRLATPGLIDAAYQGTQALSYDLATWKPEFITVPIQAPRFNLSRYACRLEIGEDADHSSVEASFLGYPEHQERLRYLALEPAAQTKLLKETLEGRDRNLQVGKTEVLHALEPRENLVWRAEVSREREPGRRLSVQPFPMVPWPFEAPKAWAATRQDTIVMPHLGILLATATFKVPQGYHLLPATPVDTKTFFGAVHWVQSQSETKDGPEGKVILRVDVETLLGGPDRYEALKTFTAAVSEAMNRLVVLEKL